MGKRGISPLIATVLIVGFTIILAVIVANFVLNSTENQIEGQEEQLQALNPEVNFEVSSVKDQSSGINRVLITNNAERAAFFILVFDTGESVTTPLVESYTSQLFYSTESASSVTVTPIVNVNGENKALSFKSASRISVLGNVTSPNDYVLKFDNGAGSYIRSDSSEVLNLFDPGNDYSIEFWYNATVLPSSWNWLFVKPFESHSPPYYQVEVNLVNSGGSGSLQASMHNQDNSTSPWLKVVGSAPPDLGTWHHVVVAYDSSVPQLDLYIDGAFKQSDNTPNGVVAPNYNSSVSMGRNYNHNGASYYYNGFIDEVRLYNRYLGPSEVNRSKSNPITNGLATRFSFNEGNGTQANSSVGSSSFNLINNVGWVEIT